MPAGNFNYAFTQHMIVFPMNYSGQTFGTATNNLIFRVVALYGGSFAFLLYLRMPSFIIFFDSTHI